MKVAEADSVQESELQGVIDMLAAGWPNSRVVKTRNANGTYRIEVHIDDPA